ncbi:hypothetical protein DFH06DRAFT_1177392 [Mycena polygramma]|nr:hypothetical protein DFH06DRAFT_1177392 [Mycena polygramma]
MKAAFASVALLLAIPIHSWGFFLATLGQRLRSPSARRGVPSSQARSLWACSKPGRTNHFVVASPRKVCSRPSVFSTILQGGLLQGLS